jgi:mono/diheme cytochrome c family protein
MQHILTRTILTTATMLIMVSVHSQDGQALFQAYCSACHTVGGGKRVGPDLINILDKRKPEWAVSFIRSSQKMIGSGDADAVAIFEEYNKIPMPDQPLTEQQAKSVLDYITVTSKNAASTDPAASQAQPTPDILAGITSDNIRQGMLLFTGRQSLTNHGPSCGACHKVKDDRVFTSGSLAKELTQAYETLGSAGVAAMIGNSPFPAMRTAYAKSPLTEAEIINLTAYLKSVSEERLYQIPRDYTSLFGLAGAFFFILSLAGIQILYLTRKKLAVNHQIFRRQTQTSN